MRKRKIVMLIIVIFLILGIGGTMILRHTTNTAVDRQIAGRISEQPISAPQLGKTDSLWRNGSGTKSDGKDTNSKNKPTRKITKNARSIIIYFSRSGSTELLASKIAEKTHADILEIVVKDSYAANYQRTLSRANSERENQDYPKIDMKVPSLSQYNTIYLGYPIWAMTLAHPMISFLNSYGKTFSNKRIAPFMTQGGYGQGNSVQRIQGILRNQGSRNNTFTRPLVVDGNKVDQADQRVTRWTEQITNSSN
ncbi:flavodoxin [Liquorilactobacillus uvarum]|nr:flavodoxin [Liquorilactobacillus uvarum]